MEKIYANQYPKFLRIFFVSLGGQGIKKALFSSINHFFIWEAFMTRNLSIFSEGILPKDE
jgi:hypothetical protein